MADEPAGVVMIDEIYEFSAPRFFDFVRGESVEEAQKAELWFETALTYAPSPFMPRIKTARTPVVETLCDFSEAANELQKDSQSSEEKPYQSESGPAEEEEKASIPVQLNANESCVDRDNCIENRDVACAKENSLASGCSAVVTGIEAHTPKPLMNHKKEPATDKKHQTAKKIASLLQNASAFRSRSQKLSSQRKSTIKPTIPKRETNASNTAGTPNLAQENQAIKRQKLDGGKSRQILNVKPHNLPHKSKLGLTSSNANLCSSTTEMSNQVGRKVYVREPAVPSAPFVSMAEMMKKFQSSTRELPLPPVNSSLHRKPKLTLTRPKEPEFDTAQRVRSVKIKSTAELEEEMMAKIPKFKARPLNKKILEAPSLPALTRSTPKPPEFQEFHFETTSRANQNLETSSTASTEVSRQNNQWKPHLTEPKTPLLQTSLRARPPRVKSSIELEQEELEKAPKFKARPLNKKIFESKGELGIFCNAKKHVTVPQEFHFATNERVPPPMDVVDFFDKLSLNSEPRHDPPRKTNPNPFHLQTEERGAEKEKKFVFEVLQKQFEEERARIPRANPYPYTTDYPVIPPKPEPKPHTKPEPFQLESLVRHEIEMQREMEERQQKEKEEAEMRSFKAQPIIKEVPIPFPEKVRKPLTQVQEFNLHVDHRAVDRAEFDVKIKEKEMMYKRYREESEAAKMIEEEKALKQLRRTMVPHARPVPNFDHPFCPQKSLKDTTRPKSPKLNVVRRKEKRRFLKAATSSPATMMR